MPRKEPKRHKLLRRTIRADGITQAVLADHLGLTFQGLAQKLSGMVPWKLWEVYEIMDELRLPLDKVAEYFPPLEQEATTDMRRRQ